MTKADAKAALERLNELAGYGNLADGLPRYGHRAEGNNYKLTLMRPIDSKRGQYRVDIVRGPLLLEEHIVDLKARAEQLGRRNRGAGVEAGMRHIAQDMLRRWNPTTTENLKRLVADIRAEGVTTLADIANELNDRGIGTPRGSSWTAGVVRRYLNQLDATEGDV